PKPWRRRRSPPWTSRFPTGPSRPMGRRARRGGLLKFSTTAGGSVADTVEETAMTRLLTMAYGVCAYVFFLVTFLWAIAFVMNIQVATTIDGGWSHSATPLVAAVVINLALLGLFAAQHSVMARRSFKRWLTCFMSPAIERSTFVLAASAAL